MKTFVLNLKRRPDRLERMRGILPAGLDVEFTTDWPIAVDGHELTPDALRGIGLFPWRIESKNTLWNRHLKMGQIGCAIAHWTCWQKSLASDDDLFMYLEDDICLVPDFLDRLHDGLARLSSYDTRWDLLYLGRYIIDPDVAVLDGIVRPGFSYSTFAYMLTRQGVAKLLATDFLTALIPVDELLPALYLDHPRPDVRERYTPALRAYAFAPPLVTHTRRTGGSDTEDSEFIASL